ncbi:hypothetical protein GF312_09005 [Candidatus Poribacteria bacterium]|nr:hypothetical protein [Candidatus Poribacteria bacterium]
MLINKVKIRNAIKYQSTNLILPIIVGFACGLEAIIVRTVIPSTFNFIIKLADLAGSFRILVPLAFLLTGALITGLLAKISGKTSGFGLDVAIRSYHLEAGLMSYSFTPLKFLSTFFTLGFGGSGGLVGPTASIGQGTASYFSRLFKLSYKDSRILALCGLAGCVSGLLHTPFGAAVFALELCYLGGIIYDDLIPVFISSVSAYIMSARIIRLIPLGNIFHQPHLFRTVIYDTPFPWSLDYIIYSILAALGTTVAGILFIKSFQWIQSFTQKRISVYYKPLIGAAMVGLVAAVFFRNNLTYVLGEAGNLVEYCASGAIYSLKMAFILLVGRWITTFLTVGFDGSGGLFAPTVLMGGLVGTIVARLLGIVNVKVLVTTGISAALVGVINVPIAAIIIVIEVFGISYLIPAVIGSTIAYLLARNFVIYPHIQNYQQYDRF